MFFFNKDNKKKDSGSEIIHTPMCVNMAIIDKLKKSLEKKRNEATTLDQLLETMLRFIPMYAWIRDIETNEVTFKNHGTKCDVFFVDEMKGIDEDTSDYVRKIKDGACFIYEGGNGLFTLPLIIKIPIVVEGKVESEVCFGLDLNATTAMFLYERIGKLENKPIRIGRDKQLLIIDTSIIVLN